jgi:hypothetical protein
MTNKHWGNSVMNNKIVHSIILALSLLTTAQVTNSAALSMKSESDSSSLVKLEAKSSLIAKAANKNSGSDTYNLKMMNTLNAAPTQNFFAVQNQKFTRFIQSLFG